MDGNNIDQIEIFIQLKKRIVLALMFLVMKTRKNIEFMYQKILWKEMLIYYWFLYIHVWSNFASCKKTFFCYFLQAFQAAEILKTHISDCFKDIGKQMIKMPTNGEHVILKNYKKNIKSPFVILKSKIRVSPIQTSIKNMLLAVMIIN